MNNNWLPSSCDISGITSEEAHQIALLHSAEHLPLCFVSPSIFPLRLFPLLTWIFCLCRSQLSSVSASDNLHSLSPSDPPRMCPRILAPVSTSFQGSEEDLTNHTSCAGAIRSRHHPLVYSLSSGKLNTLVMYSFRNKDFIAHFPL